jgi:hypothetical protein
MNAAVVGGVIRAMLAMSGGAGLASDSEIEQISGAVAVLLTIAWSIYQKRAQAAK